MRKILIVGAASGIAEACGRLWAQRGDQLFLAARNAQALQALSADLATRSGKAVGTRVFDANQLDQHAALLEDATQALGGLDTVLIAHGTLTDQARAETDTGYALAEIGTNGLSVIALMGLAAQQFERQGRGCIAVISSDFACSSLISASRRCIRSWLAGSFSLRSASTSMRSCIRRRSTSSSSSGLDSTAMRRREAASSIRSMALSGRKRSER